MFATYFQLDSLERLSLPLYIKQQPLFIFHVIIKKYLFYIDDLEVERLTFSTKLRA